MYRIIGGDGREYGPITADQVRQWIAEGRANGQTRARAEASATWRPLTEYLEFASALAGTAVPMVITTPIWVTPQTNSMAIGGLVMGILSCTIGLCCCYGFPFNVLGLIFSLTALSQIKASPATQQGRGLAMSGMVLSILSIGLSVLRVALFGAVLSAAEILDKLHK